MSGNSILNIHVLYIHVLHVGFSVVITDAIIIYIL